MTSGKYKDSKEVPIREEKGEPCPYSKNVTLCTWGKCDDCPTYRSWAGRVKAHLAGKKKVVNIAGQNYVRIGKKEAKNE
ncbi:MAG: hypothetical protein WC639_04720 [Patescibacteria group bacterium]|jgi:hypothetical protein